MTVTNSREPFASRLLAAVVGLLLPAFCFGCGRPLGVRAGAIGLCDACREPLLHRREGDPPRCSRCARLLGAAALPPGWECGPCRRRPPAHDHLLVAWTYAPPVDEVIRALKFRRLDYLGPQLGEAMVRRLGEDLVRAAAGASAVVPVPLAWYRRLRRGFNQAELLARPIAHHLGLPLVRCLRRRSRPAQSSLGRPQRGRNARGAFRCRGALGGGTVLLVDDVVTTGATLEAAAACLKAAGAGRVVAVVAASTPLRDERPEGQAGSSRGRAGSY